VTASFAAIATLLVTVAIVAIALFVSRARLPAEASSAATSTIYRIRSVYFIFILVVACQSTLLCSAYTLEDQHAFGWMLVPVGLAAYLFALVSVPRWLVPSANGR